MNTKRVVTILVVSMIALSLLTSCGPTTPEPTEAPPEPAIGSEDHPIKVLFVPSVDAGVIVSGGEVMADALEQATGLKFEVSVPTSYAATIEAMCASPEDTIGFIPALGYALASQKCGVQVGGAAVRSMVRELWAELIRADADEGDVPSTVGIAFHDEAHGAPPDVEDGASRGARCSSFYSRARARYAAIEEGE